MSILLVVVIVICTIVASVALTSYFVANAVKSASPMPPPVPGEANVVCSFRHTVIPESLNFGTRIYIINDGSPVTVNWGDGTTITSVPDSDGIISHTYGATGSYDCTLEGSNILDLRFFYTEGETPIASVLLNTINFTKASTLGTLYGAFGFENSSINIDVCKNLRVLNLQGSNITPNGITSLNLSGYTKLEDVTINDFRSLTGLDVSGLASLTTIDVQACTSLTTIDVQACTSLTTLDVYGCTSLASLNASGLTSLITLDVSNCTSLLDLNFNGCTSFNQTICNAIVDRLVNNYSFNGSLNFSNIPDISNPGTEGWAILGERGWSITV